MMLSNTLFKIGPFNICIWNILILGLLFMGAFILRRLLSRFIRKTLQSNNIQIEGRRETFIKLITQSVYLVAIYLGILSFRFNNQEITFKDFIRYNIINVGKIQISLYQILLIFVTLISAKIIVSFIKLYLGRKFRNRSDYDPGTEFIYIKLASYITYVIACIFCLNILSIDLSLILTGSVGLLVGLGLGLQDVFKDLIGGIVLLVEGNHRVGDIVEINGGMASKDNGSTVAKILKINLRTTQIQTREGNVLIIPNTRLTQQQVENWNHGSPLSRFTINITVDYGSDTENVTRLLIQAARSHPKLRKNEPVLVRLAGFGHQGIDMELIFWADQSWDINNYKSDIRFEIDRLFREYKIRIPYPTTTIHIEKNKQEV